MLLTYKFIAQLSVYITNMKDIYTAKLSLRYYLSFDHLLV